jgi:hypothetical protein
VPAQLKSFEGPDVQRLLDRIRTEFGPGAKISGAERIRVGGVLGFFSKEHYRVVVEAPERSEEIGAPPTANGVRLSRRERRRHAAVMKEAASVPEPIETPGPIEAPASETTVDVFSAMADATDDVNDFDARRTATPDPVSPTAPAATLGVNENPVAQVAPEAVPDTVSESFDTVLSRVATTLESPSAPAPVYDAGPVYDPTPGYDPGPGHGHPATNGHGAANGAAGDHGFASSEAEPESDATADIAAKAALFLAGTSALPVLEPVAEPAPGVPDPTLGALVRVGLDEATVGLVTEGLRGGAGLETVLLGAVLPLVGEVTLPRLPGSLLVVVGPGTAARRLGAALAAEMGIDPALVPYASRHRDAYAVATGPLLVRSAEEAAERAPGWRRSEPSVVVVDQAVTGAERTWAGHVIAALRPTAVWAVVDATSKTEDITAWSGDLGGVDALALENLDATVSPASALGRGLPVARLDGQPATAPRWVATIVDRISPCT